jgi:hypothetical protein
MAYYKFAPSADPLVWEVAETTQFVQLTSSSLRAERSDLAPLFSIDLLQQIGRRSGILQRVGWSRGDAFAESPLEAGETPFNFHLSQNLESDPIVVAVPAIPADAVVRRAPEWGWRMQMVPDNRPDRFGSIRPEPPSVKLDGTEMEKLTSLGDLHFWQNQNALSRSWMWWTNFTLVEFQGPPGKPESLVHRMFTYDPQGTQPKMQPYLQAVVPLNVTGEPPRLEEPEP